MLENCLNVLVVFNCGHWPAFSNSQNGGRFNVQLRWTTVKAASTVPTMDIIKSCCLYVNGSHSVSVSMEAKQAVTGQFSLLGGSCWQCSQNKKHRQQLPNIKVFVSGISGTPSVPSPKFYTFLVKRTNTDGQRQSAFTAEGYGMYHLLGTT